MKPLRHWPLLSGLRKILFFLQAIAVKSPRFISTPLSVCVEKHAHVWFRRWFGENLPAPVNTAPQDHMGITGFLRNIATRLQNTESLRPVVSAHREAGK